MANLLKLEEQLSPASRGYGCSQEADEDTTSVASDRSDDTFDMAKGNLPLLEKAIALESERAKVMRDRMSPESSFLRRDHQQHRHSNGGEERRSRLHQDGLKRPYYPKGRSNPDPKVNPEPNPDPEPDLDLDLDPDPDPESNPEPDPNPRPRPMTSDPVLSAALLSLIQNIPEGRRRRANVRLRAATAPAT